jgi:hypothetical protein
MPDDNSLGPRAPDPHDSGMEARVTALETAFGQVLAELRALRQDVADLKTTSRKMEVDLARMDGRVSQMPTLIQLVTVVIAIWGMAFATLRFAGH